MMDNVNPIVKGQILYIQEKQKLYFYVEYLVEGWVNIYIFKYLFLKDVIKELPEQPKTIYDHWILGKAFGYSDDSISKFIEKTMLQ